MKTPFQCGGAIALLLLSLQAQCQQPVAAQAPSAAAGTPASAVAQPREAPTEDSKTKPVTARDRERATKLYLSGSKLFKGEQYEQAMSEYQRAATLDPSNSNYARAVEVARSHAVTSLIQAAAKAQTAGNRSAALAALRHARELDPHNPEVAEHFTGIADDALLSNTSPLYEGSSGNAAEAPALAPAEGVRSFHLKTDARQLIQQVYKAYGIDATVDQSVPAKLTRFDLDGATFSQAINTLDIVTNTFEVPLDPHRVVAALNTAQNRQQFLRQEMETLYLPGIPSAEMTELTNVARNVFSVSQVAVEQTAGTMTLRGAPDTLNAFNATMQPLVSGDSQALLDVRIIQLAHMKERNVGLQLPQQVTAFNVYSEEQAILNANQALVQQIIASGLAAPGDTLAILGILIASGVVQNSIFSNGIALFGGGLTLTGLSPAPATLHLALNSSDSRELEDLRLHLADGQDETLISGTRYPIQLASYSSIFSAGVNIPGLTSPGTSSSLSSLLTGTTGAPLQIPQVQYQDLGLTLKATPKIMRSGDVALTLDLKITSLSGTVVNGNPVLNNRAFSGVVTLKNGVGAIVTSELDSNESRAISGTPGISEIPGFNDVTNKDVEKNYATLLIILTPHLIRGSQPAGHTPMLRIQRAEEAH
ncbi:MAG: hypothetical protein WBF42_00575 [Terracidiphilus sp.]